MKEKNTKRYRNIKKRDLPQPNKSLNTQKEGGGTHTHAHNDTPTQTHPFTPTYTHPKKTPRQTTSLHLCVGN